MDPNGSTTATDTTNTSSPTTTTTTTTTMSSQTQKQPHQQGQTADVGPPAWHAVYPPPNSDPPALTRSLLLGWMQQGRRAGKDFVLVDLRRSDHEGGSIRGSINLPAQSLYPTIPTLYDLFSAAGVKDVIFYCGSSRGRGPRAAGWFEDHIRARGDGIMKSWVLLEGIKGWAGDGVDFTRLMDEYDEKVWQGGKED